MCNVWDGMGRLLRLAAVTACLPLAGCGVISVLHAASVQEDDDRGKVGVEEVVVSAAPRRLGASPAPVPSNSRVAAVQSAATARALVDEFALMAAFSTIVYNRHLPAGQRGGTQAACDEPEGGAVLARVFPDGRWQRWRESSWGAGNNPACMSQQGLFYDTYVHRDASGRITQAVIAFRGTENFNVSTEQAGYDWGDNLSLVFGVPPRQYTLATQGVTATVAALLAANGKDAPPEIYATGHSLGGGLAQQAVYQQPAIAAAYVFNSSPVTNWSANREIGLVKVPDPVIFRIQQRGEGLVVPRWVTSRVNTRRFGRSDFEFNYQDGNLAGQHNISLLACNFAARIASQDGYAPAFLFDRTAALRAWNSGDGLCPPAVREKICRNAGLPSVPGGVCGTP